jgi:rhodanese-related sulfurtransferase
MVQNKEIATKILPSLWLGDCRAASNRDFITKNNIKSIINITVLCPNYFNDMTYLNIPIKDGELNSRKLFDVFDVTNKFIFNSLKDKKNILVHCRRGHTRSAGVVAAFIIKYLKQDFVSAVKYIRSLRERTLRDEKDMTKSVHDYYVKIHKPACHYFKQIF